MSIKGPIKITIEGPQGSGKTILSVQIQRLLDTHGISWVLFSDDEKIKPHKQVITIIEKTT